MDDIERVAGLIDSAAALIIGVGAGMGVDSGSPDFRGNDGFWKAHPALAKARSHRFPFGCLPQLVRQHPSTRLGLLRSPSQSQSQHRSA